jgi:hypothetical protein
MKEISLILAALASLTIASTSHATFAYSPVTQNYLRCLSDSDVDIAEISETATDDAQDFFTTHNSEKWYDTIANVGLSHAMKSGYKGNAAYLYMEYFDVAYRALYKDQ